jgi:hypothetical protein
LIVRSVLHDGVANQLGPDAEDAGEDIAQDADLLHHHAGVHPVQPASAPLNRIAAAHKVATTGLTKKCLGKLQTVTIHFEDHFTGDPAHQRAHVIPELLSLGR